MSSVQQDETSCGETPPGRNLWEITEDYIHSGCMSEYLYPMHTNLQTQRFMVRELKFNPSKEVYPTNTWDVKTTASQKSVS